MDNYDIFQISITFLVALIYLVDRLEPYIYTDLYKFLKQNKDTFIGIYYLYLAYELYRRSVQKLVK